MRKLLHRIEEGMDNLKIKKKLYMLYLICVLIPIIITDSVIFFIVRSSEQEKQQHEMANIANAVSYNISNTISSIGETAKSIYTSKYINSFLMQEYESAPEYVLTYQEFFKDHLLENILGMNNLVFTFYTDNETIVNGGKVNKIENIRETKAYQSLVEQKKSKGIFFVYDESRNKISKKRQIVFLQKLDFYSPNKEKILKVELDYGKVSDELKKMNYDNEVEILNEGRILLSNKKHGTESENYEKVNKRTGKKQYVVPYFMSSHPGSTLKDAIELAEYIRDLGYMPEQVQDFYPTPSTISTCMYYTGLDPRTMEPIYVPKSSHEKAMQRALIQYREPRNYDLVKEALLKAGRNDLIGFDKKCLIPPRKRKRR